jgi:hypothetical protein
MISPLCAVLILSEALMASAPAPVKGWGTVKGQVIFSGDKVPDNPIIEVNRDKKHCLSKGPIRRNELVVNPKNKGVRWVLVWLAPLKGFNMPKKGDLPIHPSLKKVPEKVEITAPCCVFEPRMIGIREGTKLVFKHSDKVTHHVFISSRPPISSVVPWWKEQVFADLEAGVLPVSYTCSVHSWMKGWVGVFHHPYFAVTDADGKFEIKNAPAGKWRLMLWQEKVGCVVQKSPEDRGKIITIKARGTTTHRISFEDRD